MSSEVTYETRTIRVRVTDAPDILNWNRTTVLVPYSVEITYTRDSVHDFNNREQVHVDCTKRLKSGAVGVAEQRVDMWRVEDRPDWVADLVEKYRPTNWLVEGEARS